MSDEILRVGTVHVLVYLSVFRRDSVHPIFLFFKKKSILFLDESLSRRQSGNGGMIYVGISQNDR